MCFFAHGMDDASGVSFFSSHFLTDPFSRFKSNVPFLKVEIHLLGTHFNAELAHISYRDVIV